MTDDLRARLEEDQRIIDAATGGPWDHFTPNPKHNRDNTVYSIELDEDELALSSYITEGATRPDAAFITTARTGYPLALRALQAVLGLHRREVRTARMTYYCGHCGDAAGWPCPTIKAIWEVYGDE